MGRKSKKEIALEVLRQLNTEELNDVLDTVKKDAPNDLYENIEALIEKECPKCHSTAYSRRGKNKLGLSVFWCKNCGHKYTIFSDTPLEKTKYEWNVWVSVLEKMLTHQSIVSTRKYLIDNHLVENIDRLTVSAMCNKLRNSFIYMPLPTLEDIVQCDEKHFRESQKGFKDPIDVLDTTRKGRRDAHRRSTPSLYGTMGPEFSTVCCAIDNKGHSVAKVVTMGQMRVEDFEDNVAIHFGKVRFLCSDMNPVYTQYASIHKTPQYVINSQYHKILKKANTPSKRQAAYEQDKLDYICGAGVMSYAKMVRFRNANHLTINDVNSFHNELERQINRIAKGVSTNHLQAWVSFLNYINNFKVDNGYVPSTYKDAEKILIDILQLHQHITVDDIKYQKDTTKRKSTRYTKKFIAKTVAARIKSNNPYIKFTEEDGVWIMDKKNTIISLPEYKRRQLAKALKIKPFSPTAVSSAELIKKLLAHPDIEEYLYILANGENTNL